MKINQISKKRQQIRRHHFLVRKVARWRKSEPLQVTYTETYADQSVRSVHDFMKEWLSFAKSPILASSGFKGVAFADTKKQLDEVAKQAWKDFNGEVSLNVEEMKDRVEAAVRGMTVPLCIKIENVVADGDMLTLDIVTNDRRLARSFQMSQDAEYQELVARIREHCGADEDAVYHCTVEESAIITRYVDQPISLTAELKKSDPPLITSEVTFDRDLYDKSV